MRQRAYGQAANAADSSPHPQDGETDTHADIQI
jgi:hypothetical protein